MCLMRVEFIKKYAYNDEKVPKKKKLKKNHLTFATIYIYCIYAAHLNR